MTNDATVCSAPDTGPDRGDGYDVISLGAVAELEPSLRAWLTCSGLLTDRLAGVPGVSLQTLSETDVSLTDDQRRLTGSSDKVGRLREISLQSGPTRYVYGTSLIPSGLLTRYPWLRELGDEPLGATLTANLSVTRSPFRYRRLAAGDPVAMRAADGVADEALWSRRSTFQLSGGLILVTEVFLPALSSWPVS